MQVLQALALQYRCNFLNFEQHTVRLADLVVQQSCLLCRTHRIKDAGLAALCTLTNLKTLNLHGNMCFTPSALQNLSQLRNLSSIQLGSNTLCNLGLAATAAALPQLAVLGVGNNRIHKTDALTGFVKLTNLVLSRNPLQLGCAKVVAGLTGLQELVMFDAVAAKSVVQLTGLAGSLTSLTIGLDPR